MRTPTFENSLAARKPELAKEWSPSNVLLATEVYPNSTVSILWICGTCSHEWEATPNYRVQRSTCPKCVQDETKQFPADFVSWSEDASKKLSSGSSAMNRWVCPSCMHSWEQRIRLFAKNPHCPKCYIAPDSVINTHPELAKEYSSRNSLPFSSFTQGSAFKATWECASGHSWEAALFTRTKGSGCPTCALENRKSRIPHKTFPSVSPWLLQEYSNKNSRKADSISYGSSYKALWECIKCQHEWKATVVDRVVSKRGCPKCSLRISKPEQEIQEWLQTYFPSSVTNDRKIISPYELDIYIPEKRIAIEFNGVYWHDENHKMDSYHYDKWKVCKKKGIQLIQIWEDDWRSNKDLILQGLAHKLSLLNLMDGFSKEYARNTFIESLNTKEAKDFLEAHHIQGFSNGSYYLGLKNRNNILIATLVLKKEPGADGKVLNIIRYATSGQVVGGFTKLLAYATKTYSPKSYLTFSDHCISDGGLYENNGFIADKELTPDYMYVVNGKRKHKFGYRLKRFKNDPDLLWEEGLSERELAILNNIPRIWDAGKTRWVKTV